MAAKAIPILDPARPSTKIRRVQESLRAIVSEDQERPGLCASVCEMLHRVDAQLNLAAELQETSEWYGSMPAL